MGFLWGKFWVKKTKTKQCNSKKKSQQTMKQNGKICILITSVEALWGTQKM